MKNKKVFAIGDLHYPQNIDVKPILKFLEDWKPDVIVFGGDIWNLDYLSHWASDNFKNIGFNTINSKLKRESEEVRELLLRFIKAGQPKDTYFLQGNHEKWVEQYTTKYPQVDDLTIKSLLRLQGLGIKYVPMEGNIRIGKQVFVHGQQYGTDNPAKQAVIRSHRNVIMFHHHKHLSWSGFSDLDVDDKTKVVCVPCYCSLAPEYLKGRPNSWSNGFYTAIVKPSGNFTSWVVEVSKNGHFLFPSGVEYL